MRQTLKLTESGSLFNVLMANNSTLPEVGKGATILLYSDRHAYEVLEVGSEGKSCVIQRYEPKRIDNDHAFSESQEYAYETLIGTPKKLVWRQNAWREVVSSIKYTKQLHEQYQQSMAGLPDVQMSKWKELVADCWKNGELIIVPGKTYLAYEYIKINIIFGRKDEYYDYTR